MCTTLPPVLVTVLGIEKLLPRFSDLEVFLQLLPRSATGERMNPYTSLWTGVTAGDGPQEFHVVLLDNGRTRVLADDVGKEALHCIRCSACLNVCPVYSRTGGHAYGSVYPGPIGAILVPQLIGIENAATLPFASTLCGACYEVCPVKIDIPKILLHLRAKAVEADGTGRRAGADACRRLDLRRATPPRRRSTPRTHRAAAVRPRELDPPPARATRQVDAHPRPRAALRRELPLLVATATHVTEAREQILARIAATARRLTAASRAAHDYRRSGALDPEERVELFCRRTGDYRAEVQRITDDEVGTAVAAVLRAHATSPRSSSHRESRPPGAAPKSSSSTTTASRRRDSTRSTAPSPAAPPRSPKPARSSSPPAPPKAAERSPSSPTSTSASS